MHALFEKSSYNLYIRVMKPWGRLIFVFIAYGLALLHTAVPHHHAGTGNGQVVFSHAACSFAHSPGGLLQRALSTDLGVGHLETFKKNADTQLEFASGEVELAADLLAASTEVASQFERSFIPKFRIKHLLFSATPLRAPPVV